MSGKRQSPNDQAQASRFAEAARAIGADEDEDAFRQKLAAVARQRVTSDPEPEKPRKPKKGE
jgi:hypothetical protein